MTRRPPVEYARTERRGLTAYQSLAEKSGRPLDEIVELAEQRRLGELFGRDGRLIGQSGAEYRAAGRDPRELLAMIKRREHPDYRSPAERVIAMHAKKYTTARGVDPRQLILQMHAMRIAEGW